MRFPIYTLIKFLECFYIFNSELIINDKKISPKDYKYLTIDINGDIFLWKYKPTFTRSKKIWKCNKEEYNYPENVQHLLSIDFPEEIIIEEEDINTCFKI